jgi:hypothetical protein
MENLETLKKKLTALQNECKEIEKIICRIKEKNDEDAPIEWDSNIIGKWIEVSEEPNIMNETKEHKRYLKVKYFCTDYDFCIIETEYHLDFSGKVRFYICDKKVTKEYLLKYYSKGKIIDDIGEIFDKITDKIKKTKIE